MSIPDGGGQPINRQTAEHYVWGSDCDGWHLVKQPELTVIEERMSPEPAKSGIITCMPGSFSTLYLEN